MEIKPKRHIILLVISIVILIVVIVRVSIRSVNNSYNYEEGIVVISDTTEVEQNTDLSEEEKKELYNF